MDILNKIVAEIFKIIYCLFLIGDIFFTGCLYHESGITLHLKIYMSLLILLTLANWIILYSQNIKTEYKIVTIAATIIFGHIALFQPDIKIDDMDFCLDTGYCAEGLEVKSDRGEFIVSEQSCLQHRYEWDFERKWCNIRPRTSKEFLND